jgi:CRISPR-associated protein Cas2
MMVLITYDVNTQTAEGRKRLRQVAKICQNYGQRVQFSVFECIVDPTQWVELRKQLVDAHDEKTDSLRFYFLGANWRRRIEIVGLEKSFDQEGLLLF